MTYPTVDFDEFEILVEKVILHPEYQNDCLHCHDLAILEVPSISSVATCDDCLATACLPSAPPRFEFGYLPHLLRVWSSNF